MERSNDPPLLEETMWEAHNWTRGERRWIGLFTLLPVIVGIAMVIRILMDPAGMLGAGEGACLLCLAHPLMIFMLLMVYAPAAFNNPALTTTMRRLWVVGFVLVGIVTLPMYWYRHVWLAPYRPDDEGLAPA